MPKPKAKDGLTDRQRRFCQEYVIDLNATQAALRAGYSAKCVNPIGIQTLAKVSVKKEIDRLQAIRGKKTGYNREQAEKEYETFRVIAETRGDVSGGVQAVRGKARLFGLDVDRKVTTDTDLASSRAVIAAISRSKARVGQRVAQDIDKAAWLKPEALPEPDQDKGLSPDPQPVIDTAQGTDTANE